MRRKRDNRSNRPLRESASRSALLFRQESAVGRNTKTQKKTFPIFSTSPCLCGEKSLNVQGVVLVSGITFPFFTFYFLLLPAAFRAGDGYRISEAEQHRGAVEFRCNKFHGGFG